MPKKPPTQVEKEEVTLDEIAVTTTEEPEDEEIAIVESPEVVSVYDPIVKIGLTSIDGVGRFSEAGVVELKQSELQSWLSDNGFAQEGGCYRKPNMIANIL